MVVRGLLVGLLALIVILPASARSAEHLPVDEIERIVRDYLMREPEIIFEAIQELQQRRESAEQDQQRRAISELQGEIFDNPGDPVVGNPAGDVTLVEFFDYRCGYCKQMAPAMQSLLAQDGNLKLVLKEFPILGPDSVVGARAALAAKIQGNYKPFHFALMEADVLSEEFVMQLAVEHGLDVVQLESDMNSEDIARQIDENIELAQLLGISGTPSFIIGETLIPGAVPVAQLSQLIDAERSAAASN